MQALDFFAAFAQLLAKPTATFRLPSLTSAIFSCNSTMGR
jgi:hypothetical protein